ncbi:hypothetical protein OPQ81_003326 [Rhizoctonia solani]|nr:hypothetical protein OPQ81_003326 [Rhizoctonia solani]
MEANARPYRSDSSLFADVPLSRVTSTAPLVHMSEPTHHHQHQHHRLKPPGCPDGWWDSLVWRLQGGGKPVPGWWDSCIAIATSSWLNILLINVPLAWTAALMRLNPLLIFGLSFLAIVPLEKLSEFGGNQFALYCGETLGEFVSITLANVVEVNLAIFLLFECELRLVQSTVIGVILLHALLVPGVAFVVGGARVLEQKLKPVHTQLNASLLFLGVVTLLLPVAFFSAYPNPHELIMANATHEGATPSVLTPQIHPARAVLPTPRQLNYVPEPLSPRPRTPDITAARHHRHRARAEAVEIDQTLRSSDGVLERNPATSEEQYLEKSAHSVAVSDETRRAIKKYSRGYAMMLIAVYILSRIYLHRHPLNDDLRLDRRPDIEHTEIEEKPVISNLKRKARVVGPGPVIILLIIVVGLIAVTAEFLVSSVEHVQQVNQLSSEWFGLILLPLISYSADALVTIVYCCRKAYRHRYSDADDLPPPEELARGRSIDLSIQFLLFWLPMLVILAWITGKPLTLLFDVFEVAAAIGACLLVNYTTQDGKTNWVEGFLLITFYFMIALAAWFYNGQLSVFELLQCQSVDELVRAGEMGLNA